jgi:hypothetical protein
MRSIQDGADTLRLSWGYPLPVTTAGQRNGLKLTNWLSANSKLFTKNTPMTVLDDWPYVCTGVKRKQGESVTKLV